MSASQEALVSARKSLAVDPMMTNTMTKRMTVYGGRSERLGEDICDLYDKRGDDRNTRFQQLQNHSSTLDERLAVSTDVATKKYVALNNQLQVFETELAEEAVQRLNLTRKNDAACASFRQYWETSLKAEQRARMGAESNILGAFDNKTAAIMREIKQTKDKGNENEASLRRYLEEDVPRLYESVRSETDAREAMEEKMLKKAMEEVAQLQSLVDVERKGREDMEEAMLRMMEDVVDKMYADIAIERKERTRAQEMLQTLLYETCFKLQKASSSL